MKHVVLLVGLVLLGSLSFSSVSAAPKEICVSTTTLFGTWDDPATWAYCTSGTVPGATHDVYIQGTVRVSSANAKNVTITAGGTLDHWMLLGLNVANLTIDSGGTFIGSAQMTGNLQNDGTIDSGSAIIFNSSTVQNISGASAITLNNMTVNNAAGVTLGRNVMINGTLALQAGDLSTGANVLSLGSGATVTAAGGGDIVGNVQRAHTFATGTNYVFNNPNTFVNFTTLTSAPTSITINLAKSAPAGFTRTLPRTYTISAVGSPSFNGTLQLHYAASEVAPAGLTEANMRAWKQVNGRWVLQTGSVTTGGTNPYVSATNVTGFSLWAISDMGTPTAVTLSSLYTNSTEHSSGLIMIVGLAMVAVTGVTQVWLRKR